MSPLEYMFSAIDAPESVAAQPVKVLTLANTPFYGALSVPLENSIAFEGLPNLKLWALYRHVGARLEIVSPFGCCHFSSEGLEASEPIGLVNSRPDGELSAWKISFGGQWKTARGDIASPLALKAKPLLDGSFEPIHSSMSFRGVDSKPDFWAMVLLPALPERVYAKDGRARMEAGGRVFALPPGKASEHVLAGRVQWGLPDQNGFFVLQKRQG